MKLICACFMMIALSPIVLLGQRTDATISGVVTDQSGALVTSATITATNTSTGSSSIANTNGSGFYILLNLKPGPYRLDVAAIGFLGYERTGIVLQVGQNQNSDVALKVGSTAERVIVTDAPSLVDTRDQTVSWAVTPQLTEALPLNGRNIEQLMSLAPDSSTHAGTNFADQSDTRPDALFITASGEGRADSTAFYLNGGLNMDTYTLAANAFPNPDAIEEFTYDTNSYSARYGGLGGGVVNAITRSGTNQFHGTAFEYLRNGDLNARNYFAATHDTLNRNQFGGSLGGPVQKDKMFAFFSFERTTLRSGTTANSAFGPTAAELNGDWSGIKAQLRDTQVGDKSNPNALTNRFTTDPTQEVPFVNNQVPVSRYNAVALKILALVPQGDPITGKITYTAVSLSNDNQYVGRVDRNIGEKLRIGVSVLQDTYVSPLIDNPKNALTDGVNETWSSQNVGVNAGYNFGPNLLTTLGVTMSRSVFFRIGATDFPNMQKLGANFPDFQPSTDHETGGYFGWFGWQSNDHKNDYRTQLDFINSWTYVRGSHTIEFGPEYVLSQSLKDQDFSGSGYTVSKCSYTGYSPLDFLLGQNCNYTQSADTYYAARGHIPAAYGNDVWRVTHRLTLNLGLRWEPWAFWPDKSTRKQGNVVSAAAFAAGTRSTRFPNLPPGLLVLGDPGIPSTLVPSYWDLFDPRMGIAWDVRGNGKTSVRLGAGLYHDLFSGVLYDFMVQSFPFDESYAITDPTVPWYSPYNTAPFNGVLPPVVSPPPPSFAFPLPLSTAVGVSPNYKPERTGQWNMTIENDLGKGFLLRVGYEGSESWHIPDTRDINSAIYIPGTNPNGSPISTSNNVPQRSPWYQNGTAYGGSVFLDESASTANYNALIVAVEKRMTGRLSLLGGYRWAKCLDVGSLVSFGHQEFSDSRNMKLDYGRCNSDIGSQLKMAAVYRLPSLQKWGFVGRNVLGGWSTSGILNWNDGVPYAISGSIDSNLDGYSGDRAAVVGNPSLPGGRSEAAKVQEWFNTAAFQNPPVGSPSASARGLLRGPNYMDLDYSLVKMFPIPYGALRETQKLEFRSEFFNLFNQTNFNNPVGSRGSAQYGQLTSAGTPRILQFALKLIF